MGVLPLAPHGGVAGAGDDLGLLWQGHPVLAGDRATQDLLRDRDARRSAADARKGARQGARPGRGAAPYTAGLAGALGRTDRRSHLAGARPAPAPSRYAGRAQTVVAP